MNLFTLFILRNAKTGSMVTNVVQYSSKADSSMKPTGHSLNIHHACQVIAWGMIKGCVVVVLYKCVTHMYGTEVPDSIRFLTAQRQMQAPVGHDWSLKVQLGDGCVCLNVCVIKGTLRLPRLQLPDAKAPMSDFSLAEDGNWPLTLLCFSSSALILCHGRQIKRAHFDLLYKILISYHL